ncbi:MAG: TonB-dependent receptor [Polyangiaceae bacterium]
MVNATRLRVYLAFGAVFVLGAATGAAASYSYTTRSFLAADENGELRDQRRLLALTRELELTGAQADSVRAILARHRPNHRKLVRSAFERCGEALSDERNQLDQRNPRDFAAVSALALRRRHAQTAREVPARPEGPVAARRRAKSLAAAQAPRYSPCSLHGLTPFRRARCVGCFAALSMARVAWAEDAPAEVTVEGERRQPNAPQRAREVAGSVVEGERLRAPGAGTKEVLRSEPGVQLVELGGMGAPATASLRGATATQTPVYLGGVRLNDEVGGTANLSDVPTFMLERVELYRSNAPLAADRLGIGGAIFFEPRRARPGENGVLTSAMLGSFGSRSWSAFGSASSQRALLSGGVELAAAKNDYPFPSGNGTLFRADDNRVARLPNADVSGQSSWLSYRQELDAATLQLFVHHASREQGAPKLALVPSRDARVGLERSLLALSSTLPIERLGGSLQLVTSAISSVTRLDNPSSELTLARPHLETPGERVEQSAWLRERTGAGLELSQQLSVSSEHLRRLESSSEKLAAERVQARLGLTLEAPLPAGLRANALLASGCAGTSDRGGPACELEAPTGRVGLGLRRRSYEVFVNAGLYRRPPTLSELYGASLLVRGNPTLEPEQGRTLEATARYQYVAAGRRWLWLDASGFLRQSDDLIIYLRTAQGYFAPQNRKSARFLGAELAGTASPFAWLELGGNVSLLDPRDRSENRNPSNDILPLLSRLTLSLNGSARYDIGRRAIASVTGTLRLSYQSSRYGTESGKGVIPEQASVDLEAAAVGVARVLTTRLRIANLFDAHRFDIVGFPLPGRSGFISMEIKL